MYYSIRLILKVTGWSIVIGTCSSIVLVTSSCRAFISEMPINLDTL